jgi:large subunit ribosomal protein L9
VEVILLEDMPGLGKSGETVKVAPGYARNFLLPREMAIASTSGSANLFREMQKRRGIRDSKLRKGSEEMARKIEGQEVTIATRAGEDDTLFGSVTSMDISAKLAEKKIDVDRRKIQLEEPIKALGVYTVPVKLPGGVVANLKVWVVRESS